ncbi:MAG TPA: class I SAM-dependent methyltransferase [Sphingomicrobium sp.]|nr:class I SAM-dependent methyltransferase [Sphingomicrobium sp.]
MEWMERVFSWRKRWAGWKFDRSHGVETRRKVACDDLTGMPSELRRHAGEYSPTHPALFRRILRKSKVSPRDFTLVDLGCGKGRILIAASAYPFRCVVGVEADQLLYEAARRNVARAGIASDVALIHGDARTALLPEGNLFIFMYSPFRGPVFEDVARRLAGLALDPDRAIVIAYSADCEAAALDRTGVFTRVRMPRRIFWARSTVSFFYNEAANQLRG